jgi:hypothetical protein
MQPKTTANFSAAKAASEHFREMADGPRLEPGSSDMAVARNRSFR